MSGRSAEAAASSCGAIEKTGTGSLKPRSGRVPNDIKPTASPISAAATASIRICPSSAAPHMRGAKFTTLPIAV
jgi:hypothetical protein